MLSEFFKNLKVETKDCFLSQVNWVASLVMVGLVVGVLGIEGCFAWCERKEGKVVGDGNVLSEGQWRDEKRDEKRDLKVLIGE